MEFGKKFTKHIIIDLIFGNKFNEMSYYKTAKWYYINYSVTPIKFKKRSYSRIKRNVNSDLYYF